MLVIVYFISCGSTCLPGLSNIKSIGNDLWLCINLIINQNNDVIYRFSSASSRLPACLDIAAASTSILFPFWQQSKLVMSGMGRL